MLKHKKWERECHEWGKGTQVISPKNKTERQWAGYKKCRQKRRNRAFIFYYILFTICFLISYLDEKLHPLLIPLFVEDEVYWRNVEYLAEEMIFFLFPRAKRFLWGWYDKTVSNPLEKLLTPPSGTLNAGYENLFSS